MVPFAKGELEELPYEPEYPENIDQVKGLIDSCASGEELDDVWKGRTAFMAAAHRSRDDDLSLDILDHFWAKYKELRCNLKDVLSRKLSYGPGRQKWSVLTNACKGGQLKVLEKVYGFYREAFTEEEFTDFLEEDPLDLFHVHREIKKSSHWVSILSLPILPEGIGKRTREVKLRASQHDHCSDDRKPAAKHNHHMHVEAGARPSKVAKAPAAAEESSKHETSSDNEEDPPDMMELTVKQRILVVLACSENHQEERQQLRHLAGVSNKNTFWTIVALLKKHEMIQEIENCLHLTPQGLAEVEEEGLSGVRPPAAMEEKEEDDQKMPARTTTRASSGSSRRAAAEDDDLIRPSAANLDGMHSLFQDLKKQEEKRHQQPNTTHTDGYSCSDGRKPVAKPSYVAMATMDNDDWSNVNCCKGATKATKEPIEAEATPRPSKRHRDSLAGSQKRQDRKRRAKEPKKCAEEVLGKQERKKPTNTKAPEQNATEQEQTAVPVSGDEDNGKEPVIRGSEQGISPEEAVSQDAVAHNFASQEAPVCATSQLTSIEMVKDIENFLGLPQNGNLSWFKRINRMEEKVGEKSDKTRGRERIEHLWNNLFVASSFITMMVEIESALGLPENVSLAFLNRIDSMEETLGRKRGGACGRERLEYLWNTLFVASSEGGGGEDMSILAMLMRLEDDLELEHVNRKLPVRIRRMEAVQAKLEGGGTFVPLVQRLEYIWRDMYG